MTVVEWLVEELSQKSRAMKIMLNAHKEILEQAKEMEKEQIIDAHTIGQDENPIFPNNQAEQYYNDTFKSE